MKQVLFFLLLCTFLNVKAQVAVNITGNNPASSSMLDVSSTSKGMLMPRMTAEQRKAVVAPEKGLLVFDTDRETIYLFNGQKWKPMMTATDASAALPSRQPVGGKVNAHFGESADIYDDYVAVGAPTDSAKGVTGGAVYIFYKNGNNWEQIAKLSAPNPEDNDWFGTSVSLSGDLLVVGAPKRNIGGAADRGAAYVFKRFVRTWSYVATLTASNGAADDEFGTAVTTNGTYVMVGAPDTDHNNATDAGSVYIYGLQNGSWTQKIILNAPDPISIGRYGTSLDSWQTKLLVGAPGASVPLGANNIKSGAAYQYNNTDAAGFTWLLGQKIFTGYRHNNMEFGTSVAIDGDKLVCGAPRYSGSPQNDLNFYQGAGFQFSYEGGSWIQKSVLTESTGEPDETGTSVALTGTAYFAGMPKWRNQHGKVMLLSPLLLFYYDEDPNLKRNFGGVVAAHNGQFVITSTQNEPYGRIFFGLVE